MSDLAVDVVTQLLANRGITVNIDESYTFASGLKSPVYTDTRGLITRVDVRRRVVATLADIMHESFPSCGVIAGVVTAGVPWAAWLADHLDLPMVYVRSAPKDRGLGRQVEGRTDGLARAVVMEDLVTTGSSSLNAVEALRRAGVSVDGVLSIFSYELPYANRIFRSAEVVHRTAAGLSDLLEVSEETFGARVATHLHDWRDTDLPIFEPQHRT